MSNESQKWVGPRGGEEVQQEMTWKKKLFNFWDFYKEYIIVVTLIVVIVGGMIINLISVKQNEPDCNIAYVGAERLSDETVAGLELLLVSLIGDIDGDGRIIVSVNQYIAEEMDGTFGSTDPTEQMRLISHLTSSSNFLFLLENPTAFQREFGLLTSMDGGSGKESPLWYAWKDCPALAALPLGEDVSNLYVSCILGEDLSEEKVRSYTEVWNRITDGAK